MNIQSKVDEALDTAVFENEFTNLMTQDSQSLAEDLKQYCSELEKYPIEDIRKAAENYQKWFHGQ